MSKMLIITGQTATGKTKKALEIASEINGELINCDSRQIYKKLDIVTGKDFTDKNYILDRKINGFDVGSYTIKILNPKSRLVPIWLYDVVDPKKYFSSFDYKLLALDVISDIFSRGKTPIIVGGAGYYLYHLLYDIPTSGIPQNWEFREELSNLNIEQLQEKYRDLDSALYIQLNNSEKSNKQRLIRRIEIADYQKKHNIKSYSNKSPSTFLTQLNLTEDSVNIQVLFEEDKEKLKKNILNRVKNRLQNGAVDEVKKLISEGYDENDPGLKTIGYQQLIAFIRGTLSIEQAEQEWIVKEMQYAKRQATFLKKYIIK